MDARVGDYLDDKLQSAADLQTLDSLLDNVKEQQELLKKQVGRNTDSLDSSDTESDKTPSSTMRERAMRMPSQNPSSMLPDSKPRRIPSRKSRVTSIADSS